DAGNAEVDGGTLLVARVGEERARAEAAHDADGTAAESVAHPHEEPQQPIGHGRTRARGAEELGDFGARGRGQAALFEDLAAEMRVEADEVEVPGLVGPVREFEPVVAAAGPRLLGNDEILA